jgi:DNA-directed RNA polymerase subunit RPC12/RpoP
MEDKIVTLESYYDPMLAQIIRGRLEANDIPCFIADEHSIGINPLYNQAMGGVKIKVFERDLDKCKEILTEKIIIEGDDTELVACPYCKSTNVFYGPAPVSQNWGSLVIAFFFSAHPIHLERTWSCMDCGTNFDPPAD